MNTGGSLPSTSLLNTNPNMAIAMCLSSVSRTRHCRIGCTHNEQNTVKVGCGATVLSDLKRLALFLGLGSLSRNLLHRRRELGSDVARVILNIDVSCADWCPQRFRVTTNTDGEVEAEMIFSHSLLAAGRMTIGYVVALLMEEGSSKVAERVEAQASNYKEALLSYI